MGAITPSSLKRESAGSCNLLIATFAATSDDGDTWASGLSSVKGYWANGTDDPTQTSESIDVSYSAGTFTFNLGEDDRSFMLYVLTDN